MYKRNGVSIQQEERDITYNIQLLQCIGPLSADPFWGLASHFLMQWKDTDPSPYSPVFSGYEIQETEGYLWAINMT